MEQVTSITPNSRLLTNWLQAVQDKFGEAIQVFQLSQQLLVGMERRAIAETPLTSELDTLCLTTKVNTCPLHLLAHSVSADPFENPGHLRTFRQRTQSAPATIRLMRQKSASVYRSFPGGRGRRAMSAIPRPQSSQMCRILATGPLT